MMKKRVFAAVLALCMLLGLLPTTAWAVSTLSITQQPSADNNYTVTATYMGQVMDQGFQWYKRVAAVTTYTLVQENPQAGQLAVDTVIYGSYTDGHWGAADERAPLSVSYLSSPGDEVTVTVLSGGDAPSGTLDGGDITFESSSGGYTATSTGGMLDIYIDNSERTSVVTATITVKRCWTPVAGQTSASLTASKSGTYYCAVSKDGEGAITNTVQVVLPHSSHPVCGAACSGHTVSHEDVEWKPLTQADFNNKTNGVTYTYNDWNSKYYTLAAGNYYLAENITIDAYVRILANTTVNLCLNGKKLSDNQYSSIPNYFLEVGGTLNLCSCADEGGEVETKSATTCIQISNSRVTVNLYNVKVIGKSSGINNNGTLIVSGGEVKGGEYRGISNVGDNAKLTLIGNPKISGVTEDLQIKTADGTTLENARVDATRYTGGTLRVKEFDQWGPLTDEKVGAYAIKGGGEGKFTLTNSCYKYEYNNGGMVIRGNHTGGTATCTNKAVCTVCQKEYGELAAHTWGETYEKDAGQHWKQCTVCQTEDTKAAHTPGDWIIDQAATVEAAGSKHKECTVCRYTTETETIPKLEQPDPGHAHQYGAWTSDAANHWHQCTAANCPDLESSKKDSAAHTEDSGTVTKPATNTEKGVRTYQCSVCQRILRTEEIPMLTEPTHSISGTVTDKDDKTVSGATVKLMRGNTEVAKTTTSGGAYSFTGVKAGIYNVVAEQGSGGDTITKTILVVLTDADATEKNIKMPDGKKNSVVEVTGADTPAVVVGGVDEIAEAQPVSSGETVTVKLTVEKKAESAADKATEIKQVASGKTLDFLDLSLVKTVTPSSGDSTDTPITDTNGKVLEIVVPYDFSGKQNVTVYRYHGGSAEALNEAKGDAKTGGTFQVRTDSVIIYATKFSTYAIGYTPEGTPEPERPSGGGGGGGGGGGSATYPPTVEESEHGKVAVSPRQPARGDKVTVTLTPDSGYQPDGVTVTDRNGKPVAVTDSGGGTYTFIQPNGKATISASFKANGGYGSCPKNHTCPVARFPDTYPTAWYHDGVHYCLEHSLMEGYDTGLFGPGDHLSRAHLVQMLYNQAGRPDMTEESSFEDVAPGAWYAKAVAWAQQSGIVSGYDSRRFHPDGWITREQLAAILWRYAGSPAATGLALDFTDAGDVSDYAVGALRWAVDWEIIYGKDGGILDPTGLATRAEAAAMLMRYGTNIT